MMTVIPSKATEELRLGELKKALKEVTDVVAAEVARDVPIFADLIKRPMNERRLLLALKLTEMGHRLMLLAAHIREDVKENTSTR